MNGGRNLFHRSVEKVFQSCDAVIVLGDGRHRDDADVAQQGNGQFIPLHFVPRVEGRQIDDLFHDLPSSVGLALAVVPCDAVLILVDDAPEARRKGHAKLGTDLDDEFFCSCTHFFVFLVGRWLRLLPNLINHLCVSKQLLIFQSTLDVSFGISSLDAFALVSFLFTTSESNFQLYFSVIIIQ